ncbi:hypothetical protein LCGC14_3060810, partial [marine sediment metagenome]
MWCEDVRRMGQRGEEMILSAYKYLGQFYDVIDKETGEKILGVEWANDKTGEMHCLVPNDDPKSPEVFAHDEQGNPKRIKRWKSIKFRRNKPLICLVTRPLWLFIGNM